MTIRDATLTLAASFQLPAHETMQSIDRDINGQWYITQAVKGTKPGGETIYINHLSVSGEFIHRATLVNAGHGTSHYLRREGRKLFVGLNVNTLDAKGKATRSDCGELEWGPYTFESTHDKWKRLGSKYTPGYGIPLRDKDSGDIVIRTSGGGKETYTKHSWAAYSANITKDGKAVQVIGTKPITIPNATGTPTHQGAAVWGDVLYRLTGNSGGTGRNPRMLTAYSFRTGAQLWEKPLLTLGGTGKYREPEGLCFDEQGVLYIGVSTKDSKGAYVHLVYALDPNDEQNPRNAVWSGWPNLIGGYEGRTNWMYADTKNLVTTGTGNLIDSQGKITLWGSLLGWKKSGFYVGFADVDKEFAKVKGLGIQRKGGFAYESKTTLRIDWDVVDWAVRSKAMEFWRILCKTFPSLPSWPADAQNALLCMAWWMGPYFTAGFPNLSAGLHEQNFFRAGDNALTRARAPRDFDHQAWFNAAGKAKAAGLDLTKPWMELPMPVTVGKNTFEARDRVSRKALDTAKANTFSVDAWYVQRALAATGFYTVLVDGLFGPMSIQALQASKMTLAQLMAKSKMFLDVTA